VKYCRGVREKLYVELRRKAGYLYDSRVTTQLHALACDMFPRLKDLHPRISLSNLAWNTKPLSRLDRGLKCSIPLTHLRRSHEASRGVLSGDQNYQTGYIQRDLAILVHDKDCCECLVRGWLGKSCRCASSALLLAVDPVM
jgi:hypothetical protein